MSREFKPGDVAMVECSDGVWRRAAFFLSVFDPPTWVFPDNTRRRVEDSNARPLVVIDPECREQVERLVAAYDGNRASDAVPVMQQALRSLIAPPKPDEPTGLGAVVEDVEGRQWVRFKSTENKPWSLNRPSAERYNAQFYADIKAVRVLSEGVTP